MKNILVTITLATLILLFGSLTFAQDEERDLQSPNSVKKTKQTPASKTVSTKNTKTDTKPKKKTIAVSNFYNAIIGNEEPQIGRQLIALFENEFTKNGTYQVVAAQQIQELLKKQETSLDERMDPATAAKIGKIASANVYVFGNITEFTLTQEGFDVVGAGGKTSYIAKLSLVINLVDVNTGITLKSVNVEQTAKKSSTKVGPFGKTITLTPELRISLFTEAAKKAVNSAVNELSPVIQNSDSLQLASQTTSSESTKTTPQSKPASTDMTRTLTNSSDSSNSSAKVSRVIKEVVYLSGLGDVKIGDILSVVRGAGAGKEIAVIEITEVNERTAKAKIIQGSGIQADDKVKIIQ